MSFFSAVINVLVWHSFFFAARVWARKSLVLRLGICSSGAKKVCCVAFWLMKFLLEGTQYFQLITVICVTMITIVSTTT